MKKILSLILAITVFSAVTAYADELGHGDLGASSDWATEEIGYAETMGMLDDFKAPWQSDITREQFCELSYNLLNFALLPEWALENPFEDSENIKVAGLYNLGVITGRSEAIFDSDGKITREEAATILFNMSELLGLDTNSMISTLQAYVDDENISSWAKNNVYNMRKIGVMTGTDTGFMPKDNITVEQAVCTLRRLYCTSEIDVNQPMGFSGKLTALIDDSENYVISPFSVKLAMMMAANGADGETKSEICDALEVYDLESENERIRELLDDYSKSDVLKLNVSNSIWINSDKTNQKFSEEYKKTTEAVFDASADVVTDENAVEKINGWVTDKTNGKITSIIDNDNAEFWSMLVNAVYFNGRWQKEFNKSLTAPDIFTDKNGTENMVDFMNKTSWMNYGENAGVEIIELPYLTREDVFDENGEYVETKILEDINVSMYLVMSDNDVSADKAVDTIETSSEFVSLSVPKFKIEYKNELSDILREIGVVRAFVNEKAEFASMFDEGNMSVSGVMHKAYISVNEEGTEAAAVTAMAMAGSSLPPEPKVVKFNKPFQFVIRDNVNGETLFAGKYSFCE